MPPVRQRRSQSLQAMTWPIRAKRSGSLSRIQARITEGAEAWGICPVRSSARRAVPSASHAAATSPARLSSDRIPGPSGRACRSSRYKPSPWAVVATAAISPAGRPDCAMTSATASAVADQSAPISRSTWRGRGINVGTRRRASATTRPASSNSTALVTVDPLSIPRSSAIVPPVQSMPTGAATTTSTPSARMSSMLRAGVAASTITVSKASSGPITCSARRSNFV